MILTGKALKDFIEYHYNQIDFTKESHEENYELFCFQTEEIHQLASVVDWLDSVGIYVGVTHDDDGKHSDFMAFSNTSFVGFYHTRQQATEKAIIKAVEIYNNRGN